MKLERGRSTFSLLSLIAGTALLTLPFTEAIPAAGQQRMLLRLHNRFRSLVSRGRFGFTVTNMNSLSWDYGLQREAGIIAHTCGRFDKSRLRADLDAMGIPLLGINDVTTRGNTSLYLMFLQWVAQKRFYDRTYGVCHWDHDCQMYMQLISAKTDKIGCSLNTRCGENSYLVCLYSPGVSESLGTSLYNTGDICTRCEQPYSFCHHGLCVACDPRIQNCDCRKTCSKNGEVRGELNSKTCTCYCYLGMGPNCDEECKNPDQYIDYDVCADVTAESCLDPEAGELLAEFCPEQCGCGRTTRLVGLK